MQSSLSKKLIIPIITFVGMIVLNVVNIIRGIQNHETWKIVVASIALVLTTAALILLLVKVSRINRQQSS